MKWIKTIDNLPPNGVYVKTKIDDEKGIRNKCKLKYLDYWGRWVSGDLAMYYTPTHWKFAKKNKN